VSAASDRSRPLALSERDFAHCRGWLFEATAIDLPEHKRSLVESRLMKRLQARGIDSYGEYFRLIERQEESAERQLARDLLTTNETSFYREPKHFDFLRTRVLPSHEGEHPFRVWSAASSSGEEPYTIAMELSEHLGLHATWEILASDISARVLEKARRATYSITRANLPRGFLEKYCLKGIADQAGLLRIQRQLRARVRFASIPLHTELPSIGPFEVVFLRNVLIYFTLETRQQVLRRIEPLIAPNGYLFVSHSESLQGLEHDLTVVQPSIYRKPA
jgi:chemotaxis protein methyltransferase CheR